MLLPRNVQVVSPQLGCRLVFLLAFAEFVGGAMKVRTSGHSLTTESTMHLASHAGVHVCARTPSESGAEFGHAKLKNCEVWQ